MSTNNPMTREQLDAIRERVEVATDGPWAVDSDDPAYIIYPEKGGWDGRVIAQVADQDGALFPVEHNGALIAHAPQDLTDLLTEVDRLRARLTVDDDMVERATHGITAHWHDMHTNESLGRQRILARAALDAALGTGEGS